MLIAQCNYFLYAMNMAVELRSTEASETWRDVITAFTRVNGVLAREMNTETDLSLDWYGILLMLSQAEMGAMRPSDLADQVSLSRSATTRLIDRMERDGLVERRSCGTDRRGTFVALTPLGEKVFRQAGRIHLQGIDQHLGSHLTTDDMANLRRILRKLSDGVDSDAMSMINANPGDR